MRALFVSFGLVALMACGKDEPVPVKTEPPAATQKARAGGARAATGGALAPGADGTLKGEVAERIDAPGYTYLRLTRGGGETWVAVPETGVAVGAEVTVTDPQPMAGFESKTLKRKFEMIYFGSLGGAPAAGGATQQPASPHGGMPQPAAPVASADLAAVKVDKATGPDGKTVAELWGQKDELKDKTVSVRGKVVKYTSGVLGKNWIHLRDGSGSDDKKDNDVTVTTGDAAAVNDVVTVQGVVHLDKDLGSGYTYPVLIEDAKVTKERQ